MGWLPLTLALLMCLTVSPVEGFTAYDCSNRSNIVEAYSLLEPDACANMGKEGEVETTVYGEIVQIKQDRMIPIFRCIVVETLVAQYCGMFSAAGVSWDIRFQELKPLEAWECRQARRSGKTLSTGRRWRARLEQPHHTACTWPVGWTTTAGWHCHPPRRQGAGWPSGTGAARDYSQGGVREVE
jgi:hypothetical protein